jgi:trehalose-phosphatase
MKVLSADVDFDTFFNSLTAASVRCLMLDYDGTLAPFRVERDQASPYPGVRQALRVIMEQAASRLLIISGRPAKDVVALLDLPHPPEIWGSHGLERLLSNGECQTTALPENVTAGLREVQQWVEQEQLTDRCEVKPSGFAFHWRGLAEPEAGELERKIRARWDPTAVKFGLALHRFDGGLELRPQHITKAEAVRQIIRESGQAAVLAYLGDDRTDEDAFRELKGHGLSVLVRDEFRETAADIWLRPPEELIDFLLRWQESGG